MATVFASGSNDFVHVSGDGLTAPEGYIDNPTATDSGDTIFAGGGGSDIINAGDGDDTIHVDDFLDPTDVFKGGAGFDTLSLDEQVSITFSATSLVGIERLLLPALSLPVNTAGFQSISTNDANVAAGDVLTIDAQALSADTFFSFDGSAESNGVFWIWGGAGNDSIVTGQGDDIVWGTSGGIDTFASGGGYDTFIMGATLTAADRITGDAASGGSVSLSGDVYAAGFAFGAATMTNITRLSVGNGSFSLTSNDATVAAGKQLEVDATSLFDNQTLIFDGSAETNGRFVMRGGMGADVLTGGARADTFDLLSYEVFFPFDVHRIGGGADTVYGGGGNDVFEGVSDFATIDGGSGVDSVHMIGTAFTDFDVSLGASSLVSIERLYLDSIDTTLDDGNVLAGKTMRVEGNASFDGSAETDGHFDLIALLGGDWKGGALADTFTISGAINLTAHGNGGNDTFTLVDGFTISAQIDGGDGRDRAIIRGNVSAGIVITGAMFANMEELVLQSRHAATVSLTDDAVQAGKRLIVDGAFLSVSSLLNFDGSAESDGRFDISGGGAGDMIRGGGGRDIISGNGGADQILGGGGADILRGGRHNDTFYYVNVADSGPNLRDTITGFTHNSDRIDLSGIDAIKGRFDNVFTYQGVTDHFTAAGQIRLAQSGGDTLLHLSIDADRQSEAVIVLQNVTATTLSELDFVL